MSRPAEPAIFDEAAFAALYGARLGDFQVPWSVFLLRYTASLRAAVGELDDVLLLVALTIASTPAGAAANAANGFDAVAGPFAAERPPPTNAMRLSDMTGIPRETVRRRLLAMASRGWLVQSPRPRREWRLAVGPEGWACVAKEFAVVHGVFLRDLTRLLGQWDRLAREAGWEGLTRPPATLSRTGLPGSGAARSP
jgi:hypothetical protein